MEKKKGPCGEGRGRGKGPGGEGGARVYKKGPGREWRDQGGQEGAWGKEGAREGRRCPWEEGGTWRR